MAAPAAATAHTPATPSPKEARRWHTSEQLLPCAILCRCAATTAAPAATAPSQGCSACIQRHCRLAAALP